MASSGDLIDFDLIETHKENIQALPSGRSAKALARILSPLGTSGTPSQTQDVNDAARAEFEREIATMDDSDDPLDIFDRYVKWTLDAYPSAQATPASQLLPLLERATKAFVKDDQYKNDPRYLKLWLHYIRYFSDTPRETFAYLARHGIGEKLALYYEEFAAWLESNGRWAQAEEIYMLGAEKGARPAERLMRKFGEFHKRASARAQDSNGPSSPALPTVRPALMAKTDPFASISATDSQAEQRKTTTTSKKAKMQIFSDESATAQPAVSSSTSSWTDMGTARERKKENTIAAQPMEGQKLSGVVKSNSGMPKMPIFKDQSQLRTKSHSISPSHPMLEKSVRNPRTGKLECVFVNLEAVYPNPHDPSEEYCFEELRAASRGWLDRDWAAERRAERPPQERVVLATREAPNVLHPAAHNDENDLAQRIEQDLNINDENEPPRQSKPPKMEIFSDADANVIAASAPAKAKKMHIFTDENENENLAQTAHARSTQPKVKTVPLKDENGDGAAVDQEAEIARRMRKEERANRTRKIKVREVRRDDQTIQTKLDSPQGPRLRKRKVAEPTMTLHTKAATDEIYEIFNAPLKSAEDVVEEESAEESSEEEEEEEDDDDDDDYTSAGESTCTGRISGATSEYGEETQGDLDAVEVEQDEQTQDTSNNTAWSEFTISRPTLDGQDETADETEAAGSESEVEQDDQSVGDGARQPVEEDVVTPEAKTINSQQRPPHHIPLPPPGVNVPTKPFRDAQQAAYNRLPFMTPIVEKTESSIGTIASRHDKDYFTAKTPCPKTSQKTPTIPEDNDELWSSPFQEAVEAVKEVQKVPAPPLLTKAKAKPAASVTHKSAGSSDAVKKGPIILDAQCNPMEESIHAAILSGMHPPLSSFEGFFDHGSESFGRKNEIKKYCRSMAGAKGKDSNKTSTVAIPPILDFKVSDRTYAIKRELGAGAYAPVYLIEHLSDDTAEDDEQKENIVSRMGKGAFSSRRAIEALKTEEPPSAWEFYILSIIHRRLGVSRPADSIIKAHEMHLFADEGYLIEDYLDQGTLLDLVNMSVAANAASSGAAIDEPLAMFFVIELLRTLEALHAKGIIHGDLKADNVMLRLNTLSSPSPTATSSSNTNSSSSSPPEELSSTYSPTGAHGWSATGIALIDFGRGIDMRAFVPTVQFIADWPTGPTDCAEMRELRPWTYQADYHGLAAIAHTLLFGKYIETVVEKGTGTALGGGSGGKRYKLKEALKRYWQGEIWGEFFEVMLNSGSAGVVEQEEGGRLPAVKGMRRCRERMEEWLVANCERGVGLRGLLRRAEGMVVERRRR